MISISGQSIKKEKRRKKKKQLAKHVQRINQKDTRIDFDNKSKSKEKKRENDPKEKEKEIGEKRKIGGRTNKQTKTKNG